MLGYYHNWLEKKKFLLLEACLSFVANKKEINKIILGIDSENQLNEILSIKTKNLTFLKP